jgi:hypothetical protein
VGDAVGDGGDCVARCMRPSCRNECSSLDLGQCLRNYVASIERIERAEENDRIPHPSTRHRSTVVVHHVVDGSVSSTLSSDRTYRTLATSNIQQEVRLLTIGEITPVGTLSSMDTAMAGE